MTDIEFYAMVEERTKALEDLLTEAHDHAHQRRIFMTNVKLKQLKSEVESILG